MSELILKNRCGNCVHCCKHTKCTLEWFDNDLCEMKSDTFSEERNNGSLAVKRDLDTRGKLCKYFDTIRAQKMREVFQEKKSKH